MSSELEGTGVGLGNSLNARGLGVIWRGRRVAGRCGRPRDGRQTTAAAEWGRRGMARGRLLVISSPFTFLPPYKVELLTHASLFLVEVLFVT